MHYERSGEGAYEKRRAVLWRIATATARRMRDARATEELLLAGAVRPETLDRLLGLSDAYTIGELDGAAVIHGGYPLRLEEDGDGPFFHQVLTPEARQATQEENGFYPVIVKNYMENFGRGYIKCKRSVQVDGRGGSRISVEEGLDAHWVGPERVDNRPLTEGYARALIAALQQTVA